MKINTEFPIILLGIIVLCLCFSCKNSYPDTAIADQKTEAFYNNYIKEELALAGVDLRLINLDSTLFFSHTNSTHDKIIAKLDREIKWIKKDYAATVAATLDDIAVLTSTITSLDLEEKEVFYQKLLAAETAKEKSYLYQMELKKLWEVKDSIKKIEGIGKDVSKLLALEREYTYLDLVKRDKNGNTQWLSTTYDEQSEVTTIQKYDDLYYQRLNQHLQAHLKDQHPKGVGDLSIMGFPIK